MIMKYISIVLLIGFFGFACQEQREDKEYVSPKDNYSKEESIKMFKEFTEEEKEEIDNFIKRHPDWNLQATETGLYYSVYIQGEGELILPGETAIVKYNIVGLDGEEYYKSDSLGTESFKVDKADIESGIHQGIKYMSKGAKAKFIIPSHLAHGLIGDMDKIPPLSAVIYDIELIDIK